ncbi:MAG TPA: hypothetical protein VN948_14420 [Terriglobales bacterium]|nr:hypothetical protein [Terriglobales bacterium]
MKRSPRPRKTADLSDSVHRQLNLYALAAGAAGVGMLALSQPTEAEIIYTPAHVRLHGQLSLDLNHDKIVDYTISTFDLDNGVTYWFLNVLGANKRNSIASTESLFAAALPVGQRVGPKRSWNGPYLYMAKWSYYAYSHGLHGSGPWFNVQHRYLGFKFLIDGHYHYGWARLNTKMTGQGTDTVLTGYAYETIPDKPIITGKEKGPDVITFKPASLGRLARGSAGLAAWRSGK